MDAIAKEVKIDAIAEEEKEEISSPDPWTELPDEVLAKIQARLPLMSLVRSRLVCKEWKASVEWSGLLQERLESGAGARDLMLFVVGKTRNISCVYDPASDRWYKLHLPPWMQTLPDVTLLDEGSLSRLERRSISSVHFPEVCAGGGVLMAHLQPRGDGAEQIIFPHIGNPVARSWACLPPFPDGLGMSHVRGVFVDAIAKCFKLVVVDDVESLHPAARTFVFDSALGSWSLTTTGLPPCESLRDLSIPRFLPAGQGVFVGTVLYCLSTKGDLLAYDLERASWSCLAVAQPVHLEPSLWQVVYSNLINVRDRLLCAAMLRNGVFGTYSLQIWEMDFARLVWTEVDSMPSLMLFLFRLEAMWKDYSLPLEAVAGQDEVYVMDEWGGKIAALNLRHTQGARRNEWGDKFLQHTQGAWRNERGDKISALDFRDTGAWRWLPSLPYKDMDRKSYYCLHPWLQFGSWVQD